MKDSKELSVMALHLTWCTITMEVEESTIPIQISLRWSVA